MSFNSKGLDRERDPVKWNKVLYLRVLIWRRRVPDVYELGMGAAPRADFSSPPFLSKSRIPGTPGKHFTEPKCSGIPGGPAEGTVQTPVRPRGVC